MSEQVTNWAGNIVFGARRVLRPTSVDEVAEIVTAGGPIRVLGSGHSFNRMADTDGTLVSLAGLPRVLEISADRRSVRVDGGVRYGELAAFLYDNGLGLGNMASLPHISVAGAIMTATHGSGQRNKNLAAAISSVELIDGTGKPATFHRGDADFEGVVVGLGALGIVTALTLDVVPSFELRQYVYDGLTRAELGAHFDEIMGNGYSVSLFTDWTSADINHVWLKRAEAMEGPWFGATPAPEKRHPVPGMPATNSTEQAGVPGPWYTRLPHFKPEFTPSNGSELQSEYHVARADGLAALDAVAAIRDQVAPVLQVCEVRTIAADDLWLSPNYERDSVALHFTWIADTDAVLPVVGALEAALAPLDPRTHWGKVFTTDPEVIRAQYPHFADFQALAQRLDPNGTFRNPWLNALLGA
ncbi:FAD-binding protein [Paractinoplanes atraurantiacus]|uniref:Xylitol oxidase n=1 Tax=Paractinoplanes atraurantiacus TaxID=1036182 RepID=A0A285J1S3_9ACTN|nr:FAD-binding protein [Actinoplanes atraurantiacus]SNY54259.1 xylitol oxidase [Actinoplanes atraurantiacus]